MLAQNGSVRTYKSDRHESPQVVTGTLKFREAFSNNLRRVYRVLVPWVEALLDKTRKEALSGKVFNTVEINEEVHIPKELLDKIKQEARKEAAEEIVKDIFHKRSCRSHEPENCKICTERQRIIDMVKDKYLKD